MIDRIVSAYRTRRWLRWSLDLATVLALVAVVAFVHTVIAGGWPAYDPFRFLQYLWS
jgi:hypothetical protein